MALCWTCFVQPLCHKSNPLLFLGLIFSFLPRLLLPNPAQHGRRLSDTTVYLPCRQNRRIFLPFTSARAPADTSCSSQAERGLVCIPGLSVLEVLLGETRVRLGELVVAGLRVEGIRVVAQGLSMAAGRSPQLDNGPCPLRCARGEGRLACGGRPP